MADPISLLSLVAGIITFIDFGFKIVSGSQSARRSLEGMTPEMGELERSIQHIQALSIPITSKISRSQWQTSIETEVVDLVRESEKLYDRLQASLNKLKIRAGARSRTFEAGRVTLRSLWSHSELQELGKQLSVLDRRIRRHVQIILEMNHQTSIMSKLKELHNTQIGYDMKHESQFDRIKEDVLDLLKVQRKEEAQITSQIATLESLNTKLNYLLHEYSNSSLHIEVIKSLYFPEVRRRFDQVLLADQRSNDWIYDAGLTGYVAWLESRVPDDNMFYIQGKAGSGKSTLMKYICEDVRTHDHLRRWAGTARLHVGSYFFWNQGSEMQKSRIGLMQSLLYQILKSAPELIPPSLKGRLHHEPWEFGDLTALFHHIAKQQGLHSRYCFFIDGLDEYNGDESDVVPMLQALSASPFVKICTSSRPGRHYDASLHRVSRNFDIAHFTRDAMCNHVRTRLSSSQKFLRLAKYEPECATIISNISQYASGVWLWVWLVTRDILFEVERDEGVGTLRRIVDEFPADLEQYFKRIIERVKDRHREEMAQIFLVTVYELQPLPLYAFTLLERERRQPGVTLEAPIQQISEVSLRPYYPKWQARIQNRCSDLLVVSEDQHPLFPTHMVDFLHRTVRDFLRDCYCVELHKFLKSPFNPLLALCQICLGLLKSVQFDNFRDPDSVNRVIGITDELLYYAHEVERTCSSEEQHALVVILDSLDAVNSHHARPDMKNHWTHARDSPSTRGKDHYKEGGHCNFLALAVQARLIRYVKSKLEAEPRKIQKSGRPLLDYALRPLRITPISMPYHSVRDDPVVSVDMVKLLLVHGANPNQAVHLLNGEPVWALFLISIHGMSQTHRRVDVARSLKRAWYQCCEALIEHGGRFDYVPDAITARNTDIATKFEEIFGSDDAAKLVQRIKEKAQERTVFGLSCLLM